MSKFIAIDFGGIYTSIYKNGEGLVFKEPSLISVKKVSDRKFKPVAFGVDCQKIMPSENLTSFSFVSRGFLSSADYCAEYLDYALNKCARDTKRKGLIAFVSVPCGTNLLQENEYIDACKKAGIGQIEIIRSPICAFMSSGQEIQTALIVDIGGVKTDVAVVDNNKIIKGATLGLGGKDINFAISKFLCEQLHISANDLEIEKLKISISSLFNNDGLSYELNAKDLHDGTNRSFSISAKQLHTVILPYFLEIIKVIKATLLELFPQVKEKVIKNPLILCGGVSATTGTSDFFSKELQIKSILHPNYENAVVLGLCGNFNKTF